MTFAYVCAQAVLCAVMSGLVAREIPLSSELLTSFSGRGRRRLRELKQQTDTVLKVDRSKSCLQAQKWVKSMGNE